MHAWDRLRITTISFVFVLVLIVNAMAVVPARADDGTPPPSTPSTGPSAKTATTSGNSTLAQVPAGIDVVVVNRSGHKVALASQQAADMIATGDPIWCPVGVAPKPGLGQCSPTQTGFSDVATWLYNFGPPKAGVIWLEDSYNSSTNLSDSLIHYFTLDGLSYTSSSLYSLTIKGGWNGISGSTITNPFSPSRFDNASLSIINWQAPVTISDIVVTNATANPYETYALSVSTNKGGITLNRVQVIDNSAGVFAGAHLDTDTATLLHPAPVTVNDSVFSNNLGNGLFIQSDGAVTIHSLTADYNGDSVTNGDGAYIDNYWENPDQPVTLTGTSEFKGNYGDGLRVESYGTVTLNNITAYRSTVYGVEINNNHGPLMPIIPTPSNVILAGTNLFTNNVQAGLSITSNGNILLNNITSTDNTGGGAYLNNCLKPGSDTACVTIGKSVTLTGINSFNRNTGGDGLNVASSGAISISQATANYNSGDGLLLDNCAYDIVILHNCTTPLPYNVALASAGTFTNNVGNGIDIEATGTVSLKNITASFNQGSWGMNIYNAANLLSARPVTVSGTNIFNGNNYFGLEIISYGAITLSNITANDNGQTGGFGGGVNLNNEGYDGGLGGSTLITRAPVTLAGVNTFDHNKYNGLQVYSVGAISISNMTASNNGIGLSYDGVYLFNTDPWRPNSGPLKKYAANVTISGFGTFENNGWAGLDIFSTGAVNLSNLTANGNYKDGVYIEAGNHALAPQSVTLTGTNTFYDNGFGSGTGNGLKVLNDGAITISNLSAINNKSDGASLDNYTWKWPGKFQGVTLTGFNTFNKNQGLYGLYINTDGSAVMSHINAEQNWTTGINVSATKNLTLMCASAFHNTNGLILSGTVLTLTGVHGYYNSFVNESLSYVTLHELPACP
jgi:hypothetical protein